MTTAPTSLLHGTKSLPGGILISKLITNRSKEIEELEKLTSKTSGSKLVFQKLPIHLRRRAMSHHVTRLPRIARQAHMNQMRKSGIPPKNKRPSRKFKRRPKNLLEDYNRRQRQHVWLETHIWHAKRFHMINRWGYRIPFKPNDKAFRACYRASAYHCLLQDISYISCIEIRGLQETIINKFKLITSTNIGLTIGAQAFINGNREGNIVLYRKNCFPFGAIGQVKFMWKAEENDKGCLWLWAHPSLYGELINCLTDIFKLDELKSDSVHNSYYSDVNDITLIELKHSLNRFRLTGPLAHSIIKKLEIPSKENVTPWFVQYLQTQKNNTIFNEQSVFWKDLNKINRTSELSPHLILNLIVTDPRYSWPTKRTKAVKQSNLDDDDMPEVPKNIKFGEIWCSDTRTKVSTNVLTTSEIIEKRKNNIVSTYTVPLDAPAIPIMLVQQPGKPDTGYSSGWDIILPSNWGRPFWFNFIMWGGRAGGIKESDLLLFEQGVPNLFYPDTKSGETEENRITEMYKTKYFSLPPNKRTNYTKFGIACPFHYAWNTIIKEWNKKPIFDSFYVLRNKKKLRILQEILSSKTKIECANVNFKEKCIVPVKLTLLKRGKVNKFSIICLPQESDYKIEPVEPIHKDKNQKIRRDIREAHQKLLKKMKRQRIRAREKGEEVHSTKQAVEEQLEKIRSLWLPETKNVRNSCAREVFGFVTNGDFSLSLAKGQCIGYIAIGVFPSLLNNKQKNIVLVRDTKSRQYKLAKMEIICT